MSEDNSNLWPEMTGDEELDISAIFGGNGGETDAPLPPMMEAAAKPAASALEEQDKVKTEPEASPETERKEKGSQKKRSPRSAKPEEQETQDLFAAFQGGGMSAEQAQTSASAAVSLYDKPPVFSYGGAKEKIEDASMTFEELRIQKADDFPELEEGKKVSWRVKYGDISKSVSDPKSATIASVKEEIEASKQFLDSLKKKKNKDVDCLVTPMITAQSKGIASYKGVYASLEEAEASGKLICLIPARDGQTYEMRRTELGRFVVPKSSIADFSEVRAGFTPALPPIPKEIMGQIISFFRFMMRSGEDYEALVYLYWDKEQEEYVPFVPKQTVRQARVDTSLIDNTLPEERYLHVADIHSHNRMEARFSQLDDANEQATRLYIVLGRLERFYPSICARVSCGGTFLEIDPFSVMESIGEAFPNVWLYRVERKQEDCQKLHCVLVPEGLEEGAS